MNYLFTGQVEGGKLKLDDKERFLGHLHTLEGKRVELTVEKQKHKRTKNQNAYYWGVVLQLIAEHTGEDVEALHDALKVHFAPKHVVGNLVVPSGTRYLDTVDFAGYVEKVRRWAAEELNINIPDPNEVSIEQ